jgi:hypothetical protein
MRLVHTVGARPRFMKASVVSFALRSSGELVVQQEAYLLQVPWVTIAR